MWRERKLRPSGLGSPDTPFRPPCQASKTGTDDKLKHKGNVTADFIFIDMDNNIIQTVISGPSSIGNARADDVVGSGAGECDHVRPRPCEMFEVVARPLQRGMSKGSSEMTGSKRKSHMPDKVFHVFIVRDRACAFHLFKKYRSLDVNLCLPSCGQTARPLSIPPQA